MPDDLAREVLPRRCEAGHSPASGTHFPGIRRGCECVAHRCRERQGGAARGTELEPDGSGGPRQRVSEAGCECSDLWCDFGAAGGRVGFLRRSSVRVCLRAGRGRPGSLSGRPAGQAGVLHARLRRTAPLAGPREKDNAKRFWNGFRPRTRRWWWPGSRRWFRWRPWRKDGGSPGRRAWGRVRVPELRRESTACCGPTVQSDEVPEMRRPHDESLERRRMPCHLEIEQVLWA
jgi:hypothetical protein